MNWKHLLYIIPITAIIFIFIGIRIGIPMGFEAVGEFEEFACQLCMDGLDVCTDMMQYVVEHNGTTQDAIKAYALENEDDIMEKFGKYGAVIE